MREESGGVEWCFSLPPSLKKQIYWNSRWWWWWWWWCGLLGRLYPHFWTQWTVGYGEFSDAAMPRPPEEDVFYDFFKAKYTTEYLEGYVDRQAFAAKGLRQRIRFGWKVNKSENLMGNGSSQESTIQVQLEWFMLQSWWWRAGLHLHQEFLASPASTVL